MTRAYATLAASGGSHTATPLEEVALANGERLPTKFSGPAGRCSIRTSRTRHRGARHRDHERDGDAANIGRPAAGKTGTAQDYKDAWFCGYMPQLAACVWVGFEDQPPSRTSRDTRPSSAARSRP